MTNVPTLEHSGVAIPAFMYGTAWKEERTESLVELALGAGFRAIDTANQRKHYYEAGVGAAVKSAIDSGRVARDELFLQTKFTYRRGQDHRLPYDPEAPLANQVAQSFALSLEHLGVESIDSYVLHGPAQRFGFSDSDWQVWRAMEQLQQEQRTKLIGVSNIAADQLRELCTDAKVKPAFVQNRCFARVGWDHGVRQLCREHDIIYQGFSLLTANREVFASPKFREIVKRVDKTGPQVVFRFALQVGMLPLTGTSDASHMAEDLAVFDFELSDADVHAIERVAL